MLVASVASGLIMATAPVNADVMVGAFVPGNAWNQQAITNLNSNLTKSMAFVNVFSSYSESWDHLYWQSSKIVSEGMLPMISWMPIDYSRYGDNLLPEIAIGNWDSYIDRWGEKLVAWVNSYPDGSQPSVLLRFGHEFNGTWYPYGDSPFWYKAAWQHVHDRFELAGVNDHIEWVWSANNVNVDSHNDVTQYYPGDDYLDWTSIDGYNWGSNFSWSSWDSFTDVFSPMYSTLVTNYPDKPIIIAEVGSAEPSDLPDPSWGQNGNDNDSQQSKDVWTAEMMSTIESDFPAIRGVTLFNIDKELSWSLTEWSSTGLQGFNGGLQSPHFTSDFLTTDETVVAAASVNISAPLSTTVADAEVTLQEISVPQADDPGWAYDMLAQVTVAPEGVVIGAAQSRIDLGKALKEEVLALTKERNQIAQLEKLIFQAEQEGDTDRVARIQTRLAKTRSRFEARKQWLLKKKEIMQKKQAARANVRNRKKISRAAQRLRAVSKPLPEINITKRDRMRNGFKNMTAEQRALFAASKRALVE